MINIDKQKKMLKAFGGAHDTNLPVARRPRHHQNPGWLREGGHPQTRMLKAKVVLPPFLPDQLQVQPVLGSWAKVGDLPLRCRKKAQRFQAAPKPLEHVGLEHEVPRLVEVQ
ncbi:unnamed protein product, partial [Heterosigma akashiwo]